MGKFWEIYLLETVGKKNGAFSGFFGPSFGLFRFYSNHVNFMRKNAGKKMRKK